MKTKLVHKTIKLNCLVFICLTFLLSSSAASQNRIKSSIGLHGTSSVSANRFGTILCPSLFYRSGKNIFSLGMMIQKYNTNLSGLQLNYEYTLLDPCLDNDCNLDWLELYAFGNINYHNKAFLGKTVCEEEYIENPEAAIDLSRLKLRAFDIYAGIGVRIILYKNLKWFNGIGFGGYEVLNSPDELFYNNKGLGLLLRTGISYQFRRQNKQNF